MKASRPIHRTDTSEVRIRLFPAILSRHAAGNQGYFTGRIRKNYLFAGSHSGAEKAAMVYSLLGSCKLQDINPYDYLQDVLERLPEHPVNRLYELLPPRWKPAKVNTGIEK